jgi:sugar O-acyltransferase (sialic acid O-acetyltransferase NeuD family)
VKIAVKIAVLGAGDLGVQLAHLVTAFGSAAPLVFFDDTKAAGSRVADREVVGGLDDGRLDALARWRDANPGAAALIGIGYRHLDLRAALSARCRALGVPLATLVAPTAWIDPSATIGEGSVIHAGCSIDQRAAIGVNVFLNPGCVVCHDARIGDDTILGPSATLCGFSQVGRRCFVGAATTVIERVAVGDGAATGAGAVVVCDVAAGELALGVPARPQRPG